MVVLCEPAPLVMTCWLSEPDEQARGHFVGACNDNPIEEIQIAAGDMPWWLAHDQCTKQDVAVECTTKSGSLLADTLLSCALSMTHELLLKQCLHEAHLQYPTLPWSTQCLRTILQHLTFF